MCVTFCTCKAFAIDDGTCTHVINTVVCVIVRVYACVCMCVRTCMHACSIDTQCIHVQMKTKEIKEKTVIYRHV